VHDDIEKGTRIIGKTCLNCQVPLKPTPYFKERKARTKQKIKLKQKPKFRRQKPCPKCFRYNIKYKPIPKKKNEKPRRWGICKDCKNSKWTETDHSRIKIKKLT